MKKYYLFLITYSFDTNYFSVVCDTKEAAIKMLENTLKKECSVIENEMEYTPSIIRHSDTDVTLIYSPIITECYMMIDYADYRIIEIEI